MASTQLTRTFTAGNRKTYTISLWLKRSSIGSSPNYQAVFLASGGDDGIFFKNDGTLDCFFHGVEKRTNRVFRDTNAWYHIMVAVDTTQSTASDRLKIYVNGEQETSFAYNSGDPAQDNENLFNNSGGVNRIGNHSSSNYQFDGLMSHIHYCDGTALAPTVFGSTDSTTGEWKINTSPSFTPGTNGFTILKDGNTITDQSANSNNFTLASGTLTKSEDCPSNVFCTLNPLQEPLPAQAVEYSFGNTKFAGNSSSWQRIYGTIGANTGKYYYEFKCLNSSGAGDALRIGWDSIDSINSGTDNYYSGLTLDRDGKIRGGEDGYNGYSPNAVQMSAAYSGGNFSFTTNDILGMAIDIDNETFSVYKNGNLEINAQSYSSYSNCSLLNSKGHFIAPSVNWYSSSGNGNRSCFNFGNGYFETTAISSEGTNASGIGKFEYDVPTGYTAFSTKGLNE